jgi:membrane protein DedA with SNARE-associated domain
LNQIAQLVTNHGYSILFAAIFARQIGLPLPAFPFMLAAGALAATGRLALVPAIGLAVAACVLADFVWYEAGRRDGDKVLHFMHRFTRDPGFHDRRAKRIFARYGPPLLLLAKFVPGLDAVAPPMAGASHISRIRFLAFETAGACLWASTYTGLGYIFSHNLNRAVAYSARTGTFAACLALAGLLVFLILKLVSCRRFLHNSRNVRVSPVDPINSKGSAVNPGTIVGSLDYDH